MCLIANVDIKLCCTFLRFVRVSPQQKFPDKTLPVHVHFGSGEGGGHTKYLLR